MNSPEALEVHSHHFVSGPRGSAHYDRSGKWVETKLTHSHPGGSTPHEHPHTGPSFYGYRQPKVTKRPTGEQFELVPLSEEDTTFELIITDSALIHGEIPIGNTPVEALGFPAA